jgi:PAS domain S-box-containing protein
MRGDGLDVVAGDGRGAPGELVADTAEPTQVLQALRESEARYRALMEHAPEAIVVLDVDTARFCEVNENACRLFGLPRTQLLARGPIELSPPVQPDGRRSADAAMEHIAAAIGGATPVFEWTHQRADGSLVPCEVRLVRLPSSEQVLVRGSVTDITERRYAQRERARTAIQRELAARARKLQRVTDAALSSLSLERLLPELAARVREVLDVDNAAVLLADEAGWLELRAASGLEACTRFRLAPGEGFAGRIAATRTAISLSGDELDIVRNPALRGLRSLLGVPLLAHDRVVGVLHVGAHTERAFSDDDTQLLRLAGDRVALAVEHARVYERERAIAHTLQQSLLPETLPDIPGVSLAARFRPLDYQVGGDFYDVVALDDDAWLLAIGDVCGKGPPAAALTALARYTLRAEAQHQRSPAALLASLNAAILRQQTTTRFLTAIVAVLRTRADGPQLTMCAGGHPLPILVDASGHAAEIGHTGPLVGALHEASYHDTVRQLHPGDSLVLYTDGVLEANAPDRLLDTPDLIHVLSDSHALEPAELARRLERYGTDGIAASALRDDIAILALRVQADTS